ncbi:hypothetical protein SAMN06272789_3689 [Streptomyces sp. 1331.2]|nr:hypothetical protein SAMN06272789_3689 [Streptomyces sp. 1331.2]
MRKLAHGVVGNAATGGSGLVAGLPNAASGNPCRNV